MSIVMRNAYARQIIRDSMDNLRRKMEAEWKSQERRHHSIPIGVWTVQKNAQIRHLFDTAKEIRGRANGIKGGINLPYRHALYRAADAMELTAIDIVKEVKMAKAKHAQRAQKKGGRTVRISIRRKKAGVRYCARITVEHRTISRAVWHKRLTDAMERVTVQSKRPWSIDDWTEMTRARLAFAHIWYKHKLRYDSVTAEDFMAYIVMTAI